MKGTDPGVQPPGFQAVLHHLGDLGQVTQSLGLAMGVVNKCLRLRAMRGIQQVETVSPLPPNRPASGASLHSPPALYLSTSGARPWGPRNQADTPAPAPAPAQAQRAPLLITAMSRAKAPGNTEEGPALGPRVWSTNQRTVRADGVGKGQEGTLEIKMGRLSHPDSTGDEESPG